MRRKYTGTSDPFDVTRANTHYEQTKEKIQKIKQAKRLIDLQHKFQSNNLKLDENDDRLDDINDISSSDEEENIKDYNLTKSSTSCSIDKIEAIIYGGVSSRFWLFRKHMISENTEKLKRQRPPFFAWECLTI